MIKVQVGHQVELACVVVGVPEPTVSWTKDNRNFPVSHDGTLILRDVKLDDEGIYTCTASNTAGQDQAQVKVQVQGGFLYIPWSLYLVPLACLNHILFLELRVSAVCEIL